MSAEDKKKAEEQKAKAQADIAGMKTAYSTLVTKYGLPAMPKEGEAEKPEPTQEEIEKLFANIDQGAFLNDALAVMKAMPGEEAKDSGPVKVPEGGLENLKIEGDKASGTVGGDPFTFVKIDGRWYVEDLPKGGSEEGAPAEGEAPPTSGPASSPQKRGTGTHFQRGTGTQFQKEGQAPVSKSVPVPLSSRLLRLRCRPLAPAAKAGADPSSGHRSRPAAGAELSKPSRKSPS